jgi:hypothetical protein
MSYRSFVPIVVNDHFEKVSPKQVKKGAVDETSDRDAAVQSLTSVIAQAEMVDKAMGNVLRAGRLYVFEIIESRFDSVIFHSVCPFTSRIKEQIVFFEEQFASIDAVWKQVITMSEALTMAYGVIWSEVFTDMGNQERTDNCVKLLDEAKVTFWETAEALETACHANQFAVQICKDFQSKYDKSPEDAAWQAWCSVKAEYENDYLKVHSNICDRDAWQAWCASRELLMDKAKDLEIAQTEFMARCWIVSKARDRATITFIEAYQIWKKAYHQISAVSKMKFWGIQTE